MNERENHRRAEVIAVKGLEREYPMGGETVAARAARGIVLRDGLIASDERRREVAGTGVAS